MIFLLARFYSNDAFAREEPVSPYTYNAERRNHLLDIYV